MSGHIIGRLWYMGQGLGPSGHQDNVGMGSSV